MKYLRKLAGFTVLFIAVFMVFALIRYQADAQVSLMPERLQYDFDEDWRVAVRDEAARDVTLPYFETHPETGTLVFENTLPEDFEGTTMRFFSKNAWVRVLLDGKELYRQEEGEGTDVEHCVDIPEAFSKGELQIELTVLEPDTETALGEIVLEMQEIVVLGLNANNLVDIVCCLLILISGVVMLMLALIRWHTGKTGRGELALGLFGLVAGIYSFIGTNTLSIFFYSTEGAYMVQDYIVLMLPLLLVFYFEHNLRTLYPRRFAALLGFVVLNAGVQLFLQWTGLGRLENMAELSTFTLCVVCVMGIVSLIQLENRDRKKETLLSLISLSVLLAGEISKLIFYSCHFYMNGNLAGMYGMSVFGVVTAVVHILRVSKEYREEADERIQTAEKQSILLAQAKKNADMARHEALVANEAKGKFLAHMSHEIRTPINAVLGMDEMILRETNERNIKEYAMDIHSAGQTLLSLINDILDFSKIESGKMEIVPVVYDFSSFIHDLVNMTMQRAADKNLCFTVEIDREIPARLYGDDVRLRQVLTNILTNAVKYTHEGTVWLRVKCQGAGESVRLLFEVEDTGIGIKKEDLPKLSAEFERIEEDRNRNIEGSGLGMNITIQLLMLLGSRLQVESTYGKGSRFWFEIGQKVIDHTPIGDFEAKVQQAADTYSYDTSVYAPDAEILVVDDNAVNRKVLRSLLKETQIQVTDADGGAQCLRFVQERHFDLIFLDHMMPEMDGIETLHRIKDLPQCPCKDTPIIVLTANAVSGAKEKYLAEGFDDFLSKPIMPDKLEAMLKAYLPKELLMTAPVKETDAAPEQKTDNAQETVLADLPLVEGLDWDYAWLHLPDMELLESTVKEFYAQLDTAAGRLEQAYLHLSEEGQLEQYRIQVHAMKSLAGTVGIVTLFGMARVLEYAARDGKTETVLAMTSVFLEEWRAYRQRLEGVFGIGDSAAQEVSDFSVIRALVEMVRVSMQEMEFDAADEAAAKLREFSYPAEIEADMQALLEAVTNLDVDEVQRVAARLSEEMADGV